MFCGKDPLQAGGRGIAPVSQIAYNRYDLKIYGLRNLLEIEKNIFPKNPKIMSFQIFIIK